MRSTEGREGGMIQREYDNKQQTTNKSQENENRKKKKKKKKTFKQFEREGERGVTWIHTHTNMKFRTMIQKHA